MAAVRVAARATSTAGGGAAGGRRRLTKLTGRRCLRRVPTAADRWWWPAWPRSTRKTSGWCAPSCGASTSRLATAPTVVGACRVATGCRPPMRWERPACSWVQRPLALVVRLHTHLGTPLAKVAHLLETRFGITVTPGGLSQVLHRTARQAAPSYAACRQVRGSPAVTPDETGWRVGAVRRPSRRLPSGPARRRGSAPSLYDAGVRTLQKQWDTLHERVIATGGHYTPDAPSPSAKPSGSNRASPPGVRQRRASRSIREGLRRCASAIRDRPPGSGRSRPATGGWWLTPSDWRSVAAPGGRSPERTSPASHRCVLQALRRAEYAVPVGVDLWMPFDSTDRNWVVARFKQWNLVQRSEFPRVSVLTVYSIFQNATPPACLPTSTAPTRSAVGTW